MSADGWPRLPDDVIGVLPEEAQWLIRQHENETIVGNKAQMMDVCANCDSKIKFARTYRALRRDLRETLQKCRAAIARLDPPCSLDEHAFAEFQRLMMSSTEDIIRHKLTVMADFFRIQWGEPIDDWAGAEGSAIDRAGCCVLLAVLASTLVASACVIVFLSS